MFSMNNKYKIRITLQRNRETQVFEVYYKYLNQKN